MKLFLLIAVAVAIASAAVAWTHGIPSVPCTNQLDFSAACNSQYLL